MLQENDSVRNKETGIVGKIVWSSFGFAIHYKSEDGKRSKTLGTSEEHILKHWEKVNEQ